MTSRRHTSHSSKLRPSPSWALYRNPPMAVGILSPFSISPPDGWAHSLLTLQRSLKSLLNSMPTSLPNMASLILYTPIPGTGYRSIFCNKLHPFGIFLYYCLQFYDSLKGHTSMTIRISWNFYKLSLDGTFHSGRKTCHRHYLPLEHMHAELRAWPHISCCSLERSRNLSGNNRRT